ncbi:transglutaminase family protein [Emticicia sp. BO119]|uniref:transglutaminase family protein n=1 Tax=Emticicia sp. BO119 TaxID=2757768 RepID=UPI0015F032EF|nr:transglutaminase family protein [Emticicia sp. BO119]MBA4853224.1 transglutaminase family protein [Emticicia sp. BO119]
MVLSVEHTLHYKYSQPVFLTPHYIYLSPKASPHQEVNDFELEINPAANILYKNIDVEGNAQYVAYINSSCEELTFKATFEIESLPTKPYHFIYFPFSAEKLPFNYPEKEALLLHPYLNLSGVTTLIHQFARQIAAEANWKTTDFLARISKYIKESFVYEKRLEGPANAAEKTLLNRKGTCRDYAVLMIASCKALGIAARFVSGYCYGSLLQQHELHAWVEVYLPGAGWRGFDPTEGKIIDDHYITLASSAQPELINPITGGFRGSAKSQLDAYVNIKRL